jgi:crotonobetainyl-CoA:carnitine CoA-transferase CaiB-like acyl-CoA transferase
VNAAEPRGGALDGIRVVDLSRILAGPVCGQLLGDHGAYVVKVEGPGGDDTRRWGRSLPGGTSSYYDSINRNKYNIGLDLTRAEDRETLWTLLENADVVVENFKSGTMAAWGMGYEEVLAERFPRLIYCRISGYGEDGPLGGLPGYDAALQAYSGLMSVNGEQGREPMRVGVPIVDTMTGHNAFAGILMALLERERSGRGQLVESTLFDTSLTLLHPHSAHWIESGELPVRTGSAHPSIAPYETFPSAGGPVFIAAANDRQFRSLTAVLGIAEVGDRADFATNSARLAHIVELRRILTERIRSREPEELCSQLLRQGVTASPVQDIAQALESPHARHRDMLVDFGASRAVGIPIKLSRTPGSLSKPPTLRDADEAEVRADLASGS